MRSISRILILLLPLVVGCGTAPDADGDPSCTHLEGNVSNLQQTLQATGLWKTDSTNLAPNGALQRADNAALRDDGFLEPLRGFAADVDFGTTVDALYPWTVGDTLWLIARGTNNTMYRRVEHTGVSFSSTGGASESEVTVTLTAHGLSIGDKFAVFESTNLSATPLGNKTVHDVVDADHFVYLDSAPDAVGVAGTATGKIATVAAYSGTFLPPTGYPMRFWEAGGNLFFTTSTGPYRLDTPTSDPVPAGSPKALEGSTTVSTPATGGWLNYGETVGYRTTWGRRTSDSTNRLILGAPSGRMLLTNTGQDKTLTHGTFTRSGSTVTMTTASAHGLTTGDSVFIAITSNDTEVTLGAKTVTVTGTTTFTFQESGSNTGTGAVEMLLNDDGVRNGVCTTYIPSGIVEGTDFCQLNRTVNTTTGGVDPGEDMALVAEKFPNASEIAAKSLTFTDIAPFANGSNAYFSPNEQGIAGALLQPPLVTDAFVYRDYALAVAQQNRRSIVLSLLAIGGRDGLAVGDGIALVDGNGDAEVYEADAVANEDTGSPGLWRFGIYSTGTVSENLESTTRSIVRVINHRSSQWMADYSSGEGEQPGRILITERNLVSGATTVEALRNQAAWSPTLKVTLTGLFQRVGSTVTVTAPTFGYKFHFSAGDKISVTAGNANFPAGVKTIATTPTDDTFTYTEAGAVAGPTSLAFTNNTPDMQMEDVLFTNSWMYSAYQQWDGFPEANFKTLGGPTNTLSRILVFGQTAIFFSNEGIHRMIGTDPSTFVLYPYPNGGEYVRLFAPNTVAKIEGGAFLLAEDGVTGIDEQAFNPNVGKPISLILKPFLTGSEALKSATKANAFAVGNIIESEYWLFLPDETAASPLYPTQAYIYSAKANGGRGGWTRYVGNTRTGVYSRTDQRMYLAPTTSGPILRERRDKRPTDFRAPNNTDGVAFGVEYVPFRGTAPTAEKQWVKAVLSVENSSTIPMPQQVGMWFSTSNDGHATWWGNQHTKHGDGIYATYAPLEVCRGAELGIKIEHSTPGEWLRIKDMAITFNQASELRRGK